VETGQNFTKLNSKNNIQNQLEKRLSVQISLYGLSFLVTSRYSKEPLYFTEVSFDNAQTPEELLQLIKETMATDDALDDSFKEINLIYNTPTYTPVPTPLFDEKKAKEYLKFSIKVLATDYVANDEIREAEVTIVYIPFMNINNWFFEKYGSFEYYHAVSLLIENLLKAEKYATGTNAYVHVSKKIFDLLIFEKGKLKFCNSFEYHTPEDFMYYILFVFEQLHLDPNLTPCILLGEINKGDSLYTILYKYVKEVQFFKPILQDSFAIENMPAHKHFVLKNSL
jgi:hypothetical protein